MDLHIASHGNDSGAGSATDPLASLSGALAHIMTWKPARAHSDAPITVWLHAGTYRFERGLRLDAINTPNRPLSFRACPGEVVRLSGGRQLPAEGMAPLLFRDDERKVVAKLRLAIIGADLAVHADIDDARATIDERPWRSQTDVWQGPLLGLFLDGATPECVRQLVFFPSGPQGDEVWYLRGPNRTPTPDIVWRATARVGGYELTARIPLAALDLDLAGPAGPVFRLQGMVHVPGSRILPLFGSNTSYNNSRRFALCSVD